MGSNRVSASIHADRFMLVVVVIVLLEEQISRIKTLTLISYLDWVLKPAKTLSYWIP